VDAKLILILAVAIVTLANAVVTALKIISDRNGKKQIGNPDNYGERIARLEEGQKDIERRMDRLEDKINGMKR